MGLSDDVEPQKPLPIDQTEVPKDGDVPKSEPLVVPVEFAIVDSPVGESRAALHYDTLSKRQIKFLEDCRTYPLIIIDCEFDHLHPEKVLASLVQQLAYSYNDCYDKGSRPILLCLVGCSGRIIPRLQKLGALQWCAFVTEEPLCSILRYNEKDCGPELIGSTTQPHPIKSRMPLKFIYLTADSPNRLPETSLTDSDPGAEPELSAGPSGGNENCDVQPQDSTPSPKQGPRGGTSSQQQANCLLSGGASTEVTRPGSPEEDADSPTSSNDAASADPLPINTAWIIGGIVDRNSHKNATLKKAELLGIETAKLPIDDSIMVGCKVLTLAAVVSIVKKRARGMTWRAAIEGSVPKRKRKGDDAPNERKRHKPMAGGVAGEEG